MFCQQYCVCLYMEKQTCKKYCKEFMSTATCALDASNLKRYHFKGKKCQIYLSIYNINIILNYSIKL